MHLVNNLFYLSIITFLLLTAGWVVKAIMSLLSGKPVSLNLSNPLNLKARWPKEKNNIEEK